MAAPTISQTWELRYAVRDEPCVTRLTTLAAMPASTALACGDFSILMIGFDPCGLPLRLATAEDISELTGLLM